MSLDLAVLNQEDRPERQVPIDVDMHANLMGLAARHRCSQFLRMQDYYSDVVFNAADVQSLKSEAEILARHVADSRANGILKEVVELADYALRKKKPIEALAD